VYDVALHRLPVVFCLDRAGITGPDGASHHGVYDMALLSKVPGMRVLAPSSAEDLAVMLHDAIGLADDNATRKLDRAQRLAHGCHRRTLSPDLISATDPAFRRCRRSDRRASHRKAERRAGRCQLAHVVSCPESLPEAYARRSRRPSGIPVSGNAACCCAAL
jgi:hypothetical protein